MIFMFLPTQTIPGFWDSVAVNLTVLCYKFSLSYFRPCTNSWTGQLGPEEIFKSNLNFHVLPHLLQSLLFLPFPNNSSPAALAGAALTCTWNQLWNSTTQRPLPPKIHLKPLGIAEQLWAHLEGVRTPQSCQSMGNGTRSCSHFPPIVGKLLFLLNLLSH